MRYKILPLTLIVNRADVIVQDAYLPSILFYGDTPVGNPRAQQPFVTLSGGDISAPYLTWSPIIYSEMFGIAYANTAVYAFLVEALALDSSFGLQWLPLCYSVRHLSLVMFNDCLRTPFALDDTLVAAIDTRIELTSAMIVAPLCSIAAMNMFLLEQMRNASMFMPQDNREPFYYIGVVDCACSANGAHTLQVGNLYRGIDTAPLLFASVVRVRATYIDAMQMHYRFATIELNRDVELQDLVSAVQFISASIV